MRQGMRPQGSDCDDKLPDKHNIGPHRVRDALAVELRDALDGAGGEGLEERGVLDAGLREGPEEVGNGVRGQLCAGERRRGKLAEEHPLCQARLREGPCGHRDVDEAPRCTDLLGRLCDSHDGCRYDCPYHSLSAWLG